CHAFKLHIQGGRDAHPTRLRLFFDILCKCTTAYPQSGDGSAVSLQLIGRWLHQKSGDGSAVSLQLIGRWLHL
ncbi:hypothetical protein QT971_12260, partial [Microcoleus sp. herbarium19]